LSESSVVIVRSSRRSNSDSSSKTRGNSESSVVYYYYEGETPAPGSNGRGNGNSNGQQQQLVDGEESTAAAGGIAAASSLIPVALIGAALGYLVFRRAQSSKSFEEMLNKNLGLGMMNPLYDDQAMFNDNPLFVKPQEQTERHGDQLDAIA
jgi:hypothetical protein